MTWPDTSGSPSPQIELDDDDGLIAVGGIECHGDAGGTGIDHPLHRHRHAVVELAEAVGRAVGDGAGAEQAGPAVAHALDDGVGAHRPQVGVAQPRETRLRQVLGGGRGAHRDGRFLADRRAQGLIPRPDGVGHRRWNRLRLDQRLDLARDRIVVGRSACGKTLHKDSDAAV